MKHLSKEFDSILDIARKNGCRIEDFGLKVRIIPPDRKISMYIAHRSQRAIHPVRRYLSNICKFNI